MALTHLVDTSVLTRLSDGAVRAPLEPPPERVIAQLLEHLHGRSGAA